MANRFDNVMRDQYSSQYVPLPLELIGNIGEKMEQEHDNVLKNQSAIQQKVSDLKLAELVYASGDKGYNYYSTGYKEAQQKLANNISQQHQALIDRYQKEGMSESDFKRESERINSNLANEYGQLKQAEVNSATIFEVDKTMRADNELGMTGHRSNAVGDEGTRFLNNPYGEYKGAALAKYVDIAEARNKLGADIGTIETELKTTYGDGYIKNGTVTEKGMEQIDGAIRGFFDSSELGMDLQGRVKADLVNQGIDPYQTYKAKYKDKDGVEKEYTTNNFNEEYSKRKESEIGAIKTQRYSRALEINRNKNWELERNEGRAYDKEQKFLELTPFDLLHSKIQTPGDLNENNPFSELGEFDDNKNFIIKPNDMSKLYKGEDGVNYNLENIPVVPGIFKDVSKTKGIYKLVDMNGKASVYNNGEFVTFVKTADNNGKPIKNIGIDSKLITKKVQAANEYYASIGVLDEMKKQFSKTGKGWEMKMANQGILDMAQNYKSGNLNSLAIAVFPETVQNQMTDYILPKTTLDNNGKMKVTNAGMISGMSLLDANGKDIPGSEEKKLELLTNAIVTGPSYIGGDVMRITTSDGNEMLLKTNSPNLANANNGIVNFVQKTSKSMIKHPSHEEQLILIAKEKEELKKSVEGMNKLINSKNPNDQMALLLQKRVLEPFQKAREEGYIKSDISYTLPNGDKVSVYNKYSKNSNKKDGNSVHQKVFISNESGTTETTASNVAAESYSYNYKTTINNSGSKNKKASESENFQNIPNP